MEDKLKELISKLKKENDKRTDSLSSGLLSEHSYSVTVHKYNCTLEIINQLENIIK